MQGFRWTQDLFTRECHGRNLTSPIGHNTARRNIEATSNPILQRSSIITQPWLLFERWTSCSDKESHNRRIATHRCSIPFSYTCETAARGSYLIPNYSSHAQRHFQTHHLLLEYPGIDQVAYKTALSAQIRIHKQFHHRKSESIYHIDPAN